MKRGVEGGTPRQFRSRFDRGAASVRHREWEWNFVAQPFHPVVNLHRDDSTRVLDFTVDA